jgi:DNA-binding winged helix-turn-helix (wHTH) protein
MGRTCLQQITSVFPKVALLNHSEKGDRLRQTRESAVPVNSPFRIVRFSSFELNLQTAELRKQGQRLRLQEQPFQILAALLERPGEVVTREELRSKLWPTDTFVDFDHGLNAAIRRLRDALDDSADTPIFIETLARRGYRFIAPIDGSPASSEPAKSIPERANSTLLRVLLAIALLMALVVVVLAWAPWRRPLRPPEIIERRLTANSAENAVSSAAVSRDGRYLAYTDKTGVFVKLIPPGETHPVPLPPDFSVHVDDWFPDGAHLLVTRQEPDRRASLWKISVFGAPHTSSLRMPREDRSLPMAPASHSAAAMYGSPVSVLQKNGSWTRTEARSSRWLWLALILRWAHQLGRQTANLSPITGVDPMIGNRSR